MLVWRYPISFALLDVWSGTGESHYLKLETRTPGFSLNACETPLRDSPRLV